MMAGAGRLVVLALAVSGGLAALAACQGAKLEPKPATAAEPAAPSAPSALRGREAGPPLPPVSANPTTAVAPDGTPMPIIHRIALDSGLVIEDLKVGEGADCLPTSTVVVKYHGTFANGRVFDSTRGQSPREFELSKLMRGWREGLPGMKVGGIRRLTIPANMAYGERGRAGDSPATTIPPDSDLSYSIELVGVK